MIEVGIFRNLVSSEINHMGLIERIAALFKSKNIDMAGTWRGEYSYSAQYPEAVKDKSVQFIAEIQTGENGYFNGIIKESEEGVPEISTVKGEIKGNRLSFVKTYQNRYQMIETGEIVITSQTPQYITYTGVFLSSEKIFVGQWKISSSYISANGQKVNHVSLGNWKMMKC
jgi:hypothetical protein